MTQLDTTTPGRTQPQMRDPATQPQRPLVAMVQRAMTATSRGRVARALVHRIVAGMPVTLVEPDGTRVGAGRPGDPVLRILDLAAYQRLGEHPKIGLGEAYVAGQWRPDEGTDLADAMVPFAARLGTILPRPVLALRGLVDRALPHHERNTRDGARANIEAHYDLSNDLFAEFLDETMTYSAALFAPGTPMAEQDLAQAQYRKIDAILDAAGVGQDTRMLEIGTGWGALAIRAAQRGAVVTSITLSTQQAELAEQRVRDAGLSERVDIAICDYRDVTGRYDAIVSVEMIEAVGAEYWPAYLGALDARLAPGGTAVVQAILMDHDRMLATRNSYGWIQKYIFPGGLIPSLPALREVAQSHTGLRVTGVHAFGPHYAQTLRRWRRRFIDRWDTIAGYGFDEAFRRTWEYYLAYSEAGFASGYLDVAQITFTRSTP